MGWGATLRAVTGNEQAGRGAEPRDARAALKRSVVRKTLAVGGRRWAPSAARSPPLREAAGKMGWNLAQDGPKSHTECHGGRVKYLTADGKSDQSATAAGPSEINREWLPPV